MIYFKGMLTRKIINSRTYLTHLNRPYGRNMGLWRIYCYRYISAQYDWARIFWCKI